MSKSVKTICLVFGFVFLLAAVFNKSLSSFLFAPEGLSLAASSICLMNQTDVDVVVSISVEGGEQMVALLLAGENGCAASPEASRKGSVKVGLHEKQGPYCQQDALAGDMLVLKTFSSDGNCQWAM